MYTCNVCTELLGTGTIEYKTEDETRTPLTNEICAVCFGIMTNIEDKVHDKSFRYCLLSALRTAIEPYGGSVMNRISFNAVQPSIIPSADALYRYHLAATEAGTNSPHSNNFIDFGNKIKQRARAVLIDCLNELNQDAPEPSLYAQHVLEEEQGHLCFYVILTPAKGVVRPLDLFQNDKSYRRRSKKRRLDGKMQGGDPRKNLELKLERDGIMVWPLNQVLAAGPSAFCHKKSAHSAEILSQPLSYQSLDIHIAVWRRPFYLRGFYTKARRDVSQSPFYVTENGLRRKLGVTSVEEQILPSVIKYTGGISDRNNDATNNQVVYGMAKFHASGREDMDVRMLLPDLSQHDFGCADLSSSITARPFVCEITDSLRLPTLADLDEIIRSINKTTINDSAGSQEKIEAAPINDHPKYFGCNPMGVGVSEVFQFAPSSAFGSLQSETEDKVKYYGCLCWSETLICNNEALQNALLTGNCFPLEIQQQTPIRVLHRRSNTLRKRHVLSCKALWIDEHFFRLHISTDAGTYVKEFVHGDLGRTRPSISSILGCKTDILELDCEGIQRNDF